MSNILTYLDRSKPYYGIPYAYCRWYTENNVKGEMFEILYSQMRPLTGVELL